jgi:hypothetical protein
MKDKLTRGLFAIDFLGHKPSLKIKSKDRYTTVFGGLTSLMIIFLSLTSVIYFGLELVLKTQPTVVVSRKTYEDFPTRNVSASEFGFYVGLQAPNYTIYIDETIYTVYSD